MHKDYISGVGLWLYYNWLVFIGFWWFGCFVITYMVHNISDLGWWPTEPEQCPAFLEVAWSTEEKTPSNPFYIGDLLSKVNDTAFGNYEEESGGFLGFFSSDESSKSDKLKSQSEKIFKRIQRLDYLEISRKPNLEVSLEKQRYDYGVNTAYASYILLIFTFVSTLWF